MSQTKCGYIAVIGSPNAGKSTLINSIVGSKVSIVTRKVQTTRFRILGIFKQESTQAILVDTPGIFNPKERLERAMVKAAWSAVHDADITCVITDASLKNIDDTTSIIKLLNEEGIRPVLLLNKIDLIDPKDLLKITQAYSDQVDVEETFMISALNGSGVEDVKNYLTKSCPEGPWLFPEDQMTDISERLLAAEITREKIFHYLHQELPYAIAVETDAWQVQKDKSVKVHQTIYVQRDNQKAIILGKNGRQVKQIGETARKEISKAVDQKIHLFLHVKVRENWAEKPDYYEMLGLDFKV